MQEFEGCLPVNTVREMALSQKLMIQAEGSPYHKEDMLESVSK